MTSETAFSVGDAVWAGRWGQAGLIYEVYPRGPGWGEGGNWGASVLLADGTDLSGFSADECGHFLHRLGNTGLRYEFVNVGQLQRDFARDIFADAFHLATTLAGRSAPSPPPGR